MRKNNNIDTIKLACDYKINPRGISHDLEGREWFRLETEQT